MKLPTNWLNETLEGAEKFHRLGIWAIHCSLFLFSGFAAFWLRFDGYIPQDMATYLWWGLSIWVVTKALVFGLFHLERVWWQFVSIDDAVRLAMANGVASIAAFAMIRLLAPPFFPRSIYLLDLVICFLTTAGLRLAVRAVTDTCSRTSRTGKRRTVIYGAGSAGISLLREIRANGKLPFTIAGLVDDDPRKQGMAIQGAKILGLGNDLSRVVAKHRVEMVLIAIPAATGPQMTRILQLCQNAGAAYKMVPGLGDVIEGAALARRIRDVAVEDLLGRKPVRIESTTVRAELRGKVVLVTGAAGSIGSELCRQIARFHPAGIVGFEIAESPLFELDREMRKSFPDTPFYPEIGNIQNRVRLEEVLKQYSPSVVYHAAAYKHVPMMEAHVFEAIENNVLGTYNVAVAAAEHKVENFVMISSDKAVRPNNIMGATKRLAELLLLSMQNGGTKYVAVRFGNVLGSNGSVIPIFKKQIAAGGPVTLTHPEMRRFFMTIPEACQLVLQASAIGEGGQVCVLDMGEPVKIVDLARNLILLSGLTPGEDIRIEFTGIRPGEKLYEELSTMLEDTAPTSHEKIRIYTGNGVPDDIAAVLDLLREICAARDVGGLVVALKEIIVDYSPSAYLLKRIIEPRDRHSVLAAVH